MDEKKISELTAYTTPIDADLLPIVDTATSSTKKITWANIKANLYASAALTGTPTAPTATAGENTTQIATTAFVQTAKVGYTVVLGGLISAPADSTNYAIATYTTSGGGADRLRVYIPKAGTIKKAYLHIGNFGTLSTAETSTFSLRLNNTTDISISAAVVTNATNYAANATLSQAVVAGDYIEGKWVTPAWVTNPGTLAITLTLYID